MPEKYESKSFLFLLVTKLYSDMEVGTKRNEKTQQNL